MATRVIDDSKLQNIAVAIQAKDNGGQMTVDEMAGRIDDIMVAPVPVHNPALILWDWDDTKLAEYSREDALALTTLPEPSTLPPYAGADHELLVFQGWNRSLASVKTWIQDHEGETRNVGAIYTTTDRQDHNFWNSPRLDTANTISMQKRGTATINPNEFQNCYSLKQVNIPDGVTDIGGNAFSNCYSLKQVNIPDGVTAIGGNAFSNCYSLKQVNIPDGVTAIGVSAFSHCYSLSQVNIPDGVTAISGSTFDNCLALSQVNIPDGVTIIRGNAFYGCYSLSRVNIPDSVTTIVDKAFQNCKILCDILNESKSTLSNADAFTGLPSNYRIYVPRANLSWHETETNWATIYAQGHIVVIEDYIAYLESIGFNVDAYKEATP